MKCLIGHCSPESVRPPTSLGDGGKDILETVIIIHAGTQLQLKEPCYDHPLNQWIFDDT